MRISISISILIVTISAFGQRVIFEDPELTFSFKKPKDWVMLDDGYEIKIAPVMADIHQTYLTVTYYDYPEPTSNGAGTHFSILTIESDTKEEFKDILWSNDHVLICGKKVLWKKSLSSTNDVLIEKRFYDFDLDKKNWELVTSIPTKDQKKYHRKFISIIKSFRIEDDQTSD